MTYRQTYEDGKPFERLPSGFYKVSVLLNESELRSLRRAAILSPHGTWSEAIRKAMGRPSSPHGLAKALREMQRRPKKTENES